MARRSNAIWPATPGPAALALSLLVLVACGAYNGPAGNGDSAPPSVAATSSPAPVDSPPLAALDPATPEPSFEPPDTVAGTSERRTINDDPEQLMGLGPQAISRLLGPPSLLRTEKPAQVWQYTAADCVLDIYLYAEEENPDRSRVTYYEIRRAQPSQRGDRACFADIIESRNMAPELTPES